jgi:hypothetical protein
MSFNPYNVFYLPIVVKTDDLNDWEKENTIEVFV